MMPPCLVLALLLVSFVPAPAFPQGLEARPHVVDAGYAFPKVIFFAAGTVDLSDYSHRTLRYWAWFLAEHPDLTGTLEAHTPYSGNTTEDLNLSARRAHLVRDALLALGANASQLRLRAFGSTRPLALDESEEARATNSRVELVF